MAEGGVASESEGLMAPAGGTGTGESPGSPPTPRFQGGFRGVLQRAVRVLARALFRIFFPVRVENPPPFEALGAVILAPNHVSFLDPPVLQVACRHHVTFLMTETIFRAGLVGWFFRFWGAIPVPEGRNAAAAIKGGLEALKRRRPVAIFPEGRISTDGCLNEGRGGVVTLMLRAGVPVIPVAILGTFEVLPRHRRWPRRGRVTVRFGSPIPPPRDPEGVDPRAFAAAIMDQIAALGAPRRP